MSTSAQQIRAFEGPAILSYGFRPFFLSAALLAALLMIVWISVLTGVFTVPTALGEIEWHAHEFLWGYLSAVVAGFLLTAIPNWTGRLPIIGAPLGLLWLVWLAGRLAIFFSIYLHPVLVAAIDVSFLFVFGYCVAREIVAGRNWRNLKVLIMLSALAAGNVVFHIETFSGADAASGYGIRIGLAAAIMMISVIGGRIVPSFTRNWLARRGPGLLPSEFNRVDQAILAITAVAVAAWVALPESELSGVLGVAAGLANVVRLARWAGWRTGAEPLVTILHVGYAFVPLGFLLLGAASLWPDAVPRAGAQHAWMAGAIVVMTLAVMTRASLGHSGRELTASKGITAIYVLVVTAALSRVAAGFFPGAGWLLYLAAAAWILGFALFAFIYAPMLARRRA